MFCPSCGVESTNKTNYCKSCGANLNQPVNTVEVHIARPPIAAMTWAIAAFGIVGFMATLAVLRDLRGETLFLCLLFLLLVVGVLSWQLGRLINTYRETIKRTVEKAENAAASPPVLSPQRQQPYVAPEQEPVSSVIENTTRTL